MRMSDPIPTFRYIVKQLAERHSSLAFIHVVEPRVHGYMDREPDEGEVGSRFMCVRRLY
jgi:NADPH2 dehydrogenase